MKPLALLCFLLALTSCSSDAITGSDASVTNPDGSTTNTGSDSGGSSDVGPTTDASIDDVCAKLADSVCAKIQSCSPFGLAIAYGDLATCKERSIKACPTGYPNSSATAARSLACATSLAAVSCKSFLSGDLGDGCNAAPGGLELNDPCADDAQCKSTFCAHSPTSKCGTCANPTAQGDPCVNQACSRGTVCPEGGTKCVKPTAGKVGDACTSQEQCAVAAASGCNTISGKCIALEVASSGGTCGADSLLATKYTLCPATGTCSAIMAGKCSAAAADGASCSTSTSGAHCMAPARCVSGTCQLPDPISCQ